MESSAHLVDPLKPEQWFGMGGEAVNTLRAFREDLHRHPELSLEEVETTRRISDAIVGLGLLERGVAEMQPLENTGLCLRILGSEGASAGGSAPTVAVRGDIDALPIVEENEVPFRSTVPGVMHACGHDVHTTWALGAAWLLSRRRPVGDVVVIFQPAEELGVGAQQVLDSGLLDDVSMIFGAHVDPRWPVGKVVAQAGPVGAATDEFVIRIAGSGGHGARPQLGSDPIVAGANLVTQLQTVVSRRVAPGDPAVATVGEFHAGTAPNVIPDNVRITGTLRSVTHPTRSLLRDSLLAMSKGVAESFRVEISVEFGGGTPPVVNDDQAVSHAADAATRLLGPSALLELSEPNMGGEDFAVYLEQMPGAFLRIGSRFEADDPVGAHTGRFLPRSECVFLGATILADAARRAGEASSS